MVTKQTERIPSPSVARATRVLEELAISSNTLSGLSKKMGIPKSSLYSIINTLIMEKWVKSDDYGNFSLGEKVFDIGNSYGKNQGVISSFRSIAKKTATETGETIFLGILEGTEVVHIARVDGTEMLRYIAEEGERIPANASALGKVLLADLEVNQLKKYYKNIPLAKLKENTISSIEELVPELEKIKDQGFALDLEESTDDLHCVSAPVRDTSGRTIASVALAAPISRFQKRSSSYISQVTETAKEISKRLGYTQIDEAPIEEEDSFA